MAAAYVSPHFKREELDKDCTSYTINVLILYQLSTVSNSELIIIVSLCYTNRDVRHRRHHPPVAKTTVWPLSPYGEEHASTTGHGYYSHRSKGRIGRLRTALPSVLAADMATVGLRLQADHDALRTLAADRTE